MGREITAEVNYGRSVVLSGSQSLITGDQPIQFENPATVLHNDSLGDYWPVGGAMLLLNRQLLRRGTSVNCDFRAGITVGGGATSYEFQCEWQQGTGIPILGKSVRVVAIPYVPDIEGSFAVSDLRVNLGAVVAPRAWSCLPPVLQQLANGADGAGLTPGETQTFTPPPLAKAVSFFCYPTQVVDPWFSQTDPYTYFFARFKHSLGGGNRSFGWLSGTVLQGAGAVPLGAGDTLVEVANGSDTTNLRAAVLWHLAPG